MAEAPRKRPGAIRDAIIDILETSPKALHTSEILAQVEKQLGKSVAPSSVRSYLRLNTPGSFERVARGTYRLSN